MSLLSVSQDKTTRNSCLIWIYSTKTYLYDFDPHKPHF